jgi:colanic acid/amylovoran biosynthesis protein WcaK/AmsJ
MNENILIINVHSLRNLGDAALLQITLQQINSNFPTGIITLSMDDPTSHSGSQKAINSIVSWVHPKKSDGTIHWNYGHLIWLLPATLLPVLTLRFFKKANYLLTPRSLKLIVEAYNQADLVISEPGGFIYSSGRGTSLVITIYSIALAIFGKKPVYILPQSIGPLKRAWERKIVRWLLNRVRIVMVREPISFRLLQDIGANKKNIQLVPDLAFAMPTSDRAIGAKWLDDLGLSIDKKSPLLGMTVINWGEQHTGFEQQAEYEKACAGAIKWFIDNTGGKVILFPQVIGPYLSQDDRIPARRIAEQLSEQSSSLYLVDQQLSVDLLKSVYSWMDILIGTRMHSIIFSLSEGVPVIMIGYLHKTRGMAEMFGIDEWFVDIRQVVGDVLVERIRKFWKNQLFWTDDRKKIISKSIYEASQVGDKVKDDYLRWLQENK